jgi:integrase
MSRSPSIPSYRFHKASGQAIVTLAGKDHYLGPHGTDESKDDYRRRVKEWLSDGAPRVSSRRDLNVDDVLAEFVPYAEQQYGSSLGRSNEYRNWYRPAIRALRREYGGCSLHQLSAASLKVVREAMVEEGLAITTINGRVKRIQRIFRWAAARQLVSAGLATELGSVASLRAGELGLVAPPRRLPVPQEHVDAVLPFLNDQLAAMVKLMSTTGMRVGEVSRLSIDQLDRETHAQRDVWVYSPREHKSAHHGIGRLICLGPGDVAVLRPFVKDVSADERIFSPRKADQVARRERDASSTAAALLLRDRQAARRRSRGVPERVLNDHYTDTAIRQAIASACKKAGVPRWVPHQLRHTAASRIANDPTGGPHLASLALGHRSMRTTEQYIHIHPQQLVQFAARQVG